MQLPEHRGAGVQSLLAAGCVIPTRVPAIFAAGRGAPHPGDTPGPFPAGQRPVGVFLCFENEKNIQGDEVFDYGPIFHFATPIVHLYAGDAPQCPGGPFESYLHCMVKTLGGSCDYLGLPRDASI
jgi:hypothetical protein